MADVKWIKIVTDIFDDEKVLLIESMPDADSIIVIWFKLLCLAGRQNNSGVFLMNGHIPYTDEMFATIFRRPLNTVRMALKTFEAYGMIEIIDGTVTIPNWGKHQNFDKIEAKTNYMREYMREYRKKQKMLLDGETNCKANNKAKVSEADKNKSKNKSSSGAINAFGETDEKPDFNTVEAYASGNLRVMTPGNMEELAEFKKELPDELIRYAIDEAGAEGVRTWAYVRKILNRCTEQGIKTVGDAKARKGTRSSPQVEQAKPLGQFF